MSFDASAASHSSGTTMEKAFFRAGVKSPEQQAMEMLDRHWQKHKPDIPRTLEAFADELRGLSPILMAVIGETAFVSRVRAFSFGPCNSTNGQKGHPGIVGQFRHNRGLIAAKARYSEHILSTDKRSIASREYRRQRGAVQASKIITDGMLLSGHTASGRPLAKCRQAALEYADRKRRGIVRVSVDIDTRNKAIDFVSKLPSQLRNLSINGLPIADVTKEAALAWCETRQKQTGLVERWCSLVADPRKTLGEQLTQEIVTELVRAAE